MKKNITTKQLLSFWREIQNYKAQGSILAIYFDSKNREFERLNGIRINSAMNEAREIELNYFEHEMEKSGDIKWIMSKDDKGREVRTLKEGLLMEDYDTAINSLMNREVAIEV